MHRTLDRIPLSTNLLTLRSLVISHSQISDLAFLRHATNLEELYADYCGISSFASLEQCYRLRVLVARGNNVRFVGYLPSLKTIDVRQNAAQLQFTRSMPELERLYAYVDCFSHFEKLFLGAFYSSEHIFYYKYKKNGDFIAFDEEKTSFCAKTHNLQRQIRVKAFYIVEQTEVSLVSTYILYISQLNELPLSSIYLHSNACGHKFEDECFPYIQQIYQRRARKIKKNKYFSVVCIEIDNSAVCFVVNPVGRQLLDVELLRYRQQRNEYRHIVIEYALPVDYPGSEGAETENDSENEVRVLKCYRVKIIRKKIEPTPRATVKKAAEELLEVSQEPEIVEAPDLPQTGMHIWTEGSYIVGYKVGFFAEADIDCIACYVSQQYRHVFLEQLVLANARQVSNVEEAQNALKYSFEDYNLNNYEAGSSLYRAHLKIGATDFPVELRSSELKANPMVELTLETQDRLVFLVLKCKNQFYHHVLPAFIACYVVFSSLKLIQYGGYISAQPYEISHDLVAKSTCYNLKFTFFKNNLVVQEGTQSFCCIDSYVGRFKCKCQAFTYSGIPISDIIVSNQVHVKHDGQSSLKESKQTESSAISGPFAEKFNFVRPSPSSTIVNLKQSKQSKLYQQINADETFDEISEVSSAYVIETGSSAASVQLNDHSSIRSNMTLNLINYAITQSDSKFSQFERIKHLYEPLKTRLRLIFLRNQFKDNKQMRLDTLLRQFDGVQEPSVFWFKNQLFEFNQPELRTRAVYLDYQFDFYVETAFIYSKYCDATHSGVSKSKFLVCRSTKGGWAFLLEDASNAVSFCLPVCTKYYIVSYDAYKEQLKQVKRLDTLGLEHSFVKANSTSYQVQTYILCLEGVLIPFNASYDCVGALNKTLATAYNEVAGSFSENSASSKRYNQLAVNRFASITAYKALAERLFGLERSLPPSFTQLQSEYANEDCIFKKQHALVKFILQIANNCSKTVAFDLADQLVESIDNSVHTDFALLVVQYLFMYPILSNYDVFRGIDFPQIRERYLTLQMKVNQKLIDQYLPCELQMMATLQQERLPTGAPDRNKVNIVILKTDGTKIASTEWPTGEHKSIANYDEFLIDFMGEDFQVYLQMLPYFINSEEIDMIKISKLFPKEFYQVLYAARRISSQNDDCRIEDVAVSYHMQQGGGFTVFFYLLCRSTENLLKDYKELSSQICYYYGESQYDNLSYCLAYMATGCGNAASYAILYKEFYSIIGYKMVFVDKKTGFLKMHSFSNSTIKRQILQLCSGFSVRQQDIFKQIVTGTSTIYLFTTRNALLGNQDYYICNASAACLRLLRMFLPKVFAELCEMATQLQIFAISSYQIEDENQHEQDCEKSMSNEENNMHPYRGRIDEMDESNYELIQAISELYDDQRASSIPMLNAVMFKNKMNEALGFAGCDLSRADRNDLQCLADDRLTCLSTKPMDCRNMARLSDEYTYCYVVVMRYSVRSYDFGQWRKIEAK